jgi:hypothetical protein
MAQYNKTMWVNNETVVDAQKLNKLENQMHLMTQSSITNAERLTAVEDLVDTKIDDVTTTESDDGTIVDFYANGVKKETITVQGGNGVKIGPDEPINKKTLWVDTNDENVDEVLRESEILSEFQEALGAMRKSVDRFDYALNYKLDAGYFKDKEPGTSGINEPDPNVPEGLTPRPEGTVAAITVKRGYKKDIEGLQEGEMGFCLDTEELYIGNKGTLRLLAKVGGLGGGSGSGSLTGKYVELETDSGSKFRIHVDEEGNLHALPAAVDTINPPDISEASKFDGLVIRHVYGGGLPDTNRTIVSHGFIELYNNTQYTFNLKGLSIQYATANEPWKALPLRGIIKPYHSFLIRCAQHTDINKPNLRYKINDFDMHWDIALSDKSMKVYLCVGTEPCQYSNPFDINNGGGMKAPGYINLFGVGGVTEASNGAISNDFPIDAYEKNFRYVIDKNTSAYRIDSGDFKDSMTGKTNKNFCFADTGDNFLDIRGLDLRIADPEIYKPRSSSYGMWNTYYNKLKLDEVVPTMINICFGEDAHTTRTFTWQTMPTHKGSLQYKKKGTSSWTTIESNKKTIAHPDTNATVHSVIVNGLSTGIYEYRVGSEGRWTDVHEIEIKAPTTSDAINFLQVSDQQSWTEEEYEVWGKVINEAVNRENFDFIMNPGDISQNGGGRSYEWRYYYDKAPILKNKVHMTVCGNNDLTYDEVQDRKIDPVAFTWYSTVENSPYVSCYSFNYGYIHFICLNSNIITEDSGIDTQQIEWMREDMAKPENQKRWTIVMMHEAPYTQTRSKLLTKFITPFAELGVDLVLCGHHHRYTRSKRMGALGPKGENRESSTGFYTVMGQAAGNKLKGKAPIATNNHEYMEVYDDTKVPCYIMWHVTHENIVMKAYKVHNVYPIEDSVGKTPEIEMFDTFTITKPLTKQIKKRNRK